MKNVTPTSTPDADTIHVFERAGLGKAPFRYIGMVEQDLCYGQKILNREEYSRTGILLTTKPGGTCAYCGAYIINMCQVQSSDGRTFHVGSDCIEKTSDAGLRKVVAKDLKAVQQARDNARIAAAKVLLTDDSVKANLDALPHPFPHMARKGHTLLNYIEWTLTRAGRAGTLKVVRMIEKATR
jgi:hypothetical protein